MVLPIHDSGQQNASADYEMFSDVEKELWNYQPCFWIAKQQSALGISVQATPGQPAQINYNLSGTNVRVNINSIDSSVNVTDQAPLEVFQQLLAAVQDTTADPELVAKMTAAVEDMERDCGNERSHLKSLGRITYCLSTRAVRPCTLESFKSLRET
jgi:hypothetical protein